ncbi:hypothetical protein HO133_010799 [Letharia lupina]|uniref:Acetyl-CoA synthetase-like protein n=1 Tax=Letharia lupina TaxID=560253 RepID=A0A8H6FDU7_9LECA|nr:uncharacterized protein HO133_010799 [Letharia lupina]KAF6224224.1 hypothetical protein HO133_010799 [Letharia lupina]
MPFKSTQPDIPLPTDVTIWDWLFDSPSSSLKKHPSSALRGYSNGITGERINYAQVQEATTYLSTALVKRYGLKEGEAVALFSPNNIWYPVAMLGTLRAGGVVSGASPAYNIEEMTYALNKAGARFLMTVPASMDVAAAAAKSAGIPKERVFLLEGELEGFTAMQTLLDIGRSYAENGQIPSFKIPEGKESKDVCAFLSFSSGTTGLPKAVMIAHQNVIAQVLQVQMITPPNLQKILAVLPVFHITGLVHALHLPISINAEVYMLPAFTMKDLLDTVVKHQLRELLLVPPILIRLVRDPLVDKYDLSCLRRFSTGAAPLSEEILHLLKKKFPQTEFKQEKYDYRYGHTVGTICASTEIKVIDLYGNELGLNQPGEILTRGPQITMGYLNNPKATAETFDKDGWLHTGDQGIIDEEGMLTITDRIKELIKVKGIVEDAAVMSVPDDYTGERPKAYVVPKDEFEGSQEFGQELIKYVQERKSRTKWITELEFVGIIPKSASGKILRRMLRDQAKADKSTKLKDDVKEKAKL